tara:strand:- start:12414 stop:13013 length:600 start_codon:yes stop_codon:yes gene_type:complete
MIKRSSLIQFSLISITLIIILIVYLNYFKTSEKSTYNENKVIEKKENFSSENLIQDLFYKSEDKKGNKYEIKSKDGVISSQDNNLIFMNKVKAVIFLNNGKRVLINSNSAEYNNNNNDTLFKGSVEMQYDEHFMVSDFLSLSFENQVATIYENVSYKSFTSTLKADKIIINIFNKNTQIFMKRLDQNILVKSTLKDGDN